MDILIWLGIIACLSQSAMFSGANLAYFSLGRMRLEAEVEKGNGPARKILALRKDSNLLLCTILWGNVSVNVLLTMLSDSVSAGVWAFVLSTVGITFFGEIIPQAYFSRHAMKVGAFLSPVIRVYQVLFFIVAKPCAIILDAWIGPEGPTFYRERDIEIILEKHISEKDSEISANEGRGALNFLALDDLHIADEGNEVDPRTVYTFPVNLDRSVLPDANEAAGVSWRESLKKHPTKSAVILGPEGEPRLVLRTTDYLSALYSMGDRVEVDDYCYRPIIVDSPQSTLDDVLGDFVVEAEDDNDHVVDRDVVLYWTSAKKRIITGADIFGELLLGIAKREDDSESSRKS